MAETLPEPAPKWLTKAGAELGYDDYDLMALFSRGSNPEERAKVTARARELEALAAPKPASLLARVFAEFPEADREALLHENALEVLRYGVGRYHDLPEGHWLRIDLEKAQKVDEAIALISRFGSSEGEHHKAWVIDQVVRLLHPNYEQWVIEQRKGPDGPDTYEWDVGIAP